ncbi:MAG TPA: hypothetical protein VN039_10445 [Nitrospira sp.]|nr:hypothetical protein [Nitrospira sp.]
MFEKIREALTKLDPFNDAHWTTDGQPRLDTLKFFAGEDVNREQVLSAAPEFTRTTAQAAVQADPAAQGDNGTGDGAAAAPVANSAAPVVPPIPPVPQESETPNLGGTQMADTSASDELEGQIKDLDTRIEDLRQDIAAATTFMKGVQAERDALQKKWDALQPPEHIRHTNAVQDYLAARRAQLAERKDNKDAIKSAGLDLKQLAGRMRAPIDAVRQRSTVLGVKRPPGV